MQIKISHIIYFQFIWSFACYFFVKYYLCLNLIMAILQNKSFLHLLMVSVLEANYLLLINRYENNPFIMNEAPIF